MCVSRICIPNMFVNFKDKANWSFVCARVLPCAIKIFQGVATAKELWIETSKRHLKVGGGVGGNEQ